MDFTLYSEKSSSDCIKALTDRLHQSETPTRPGLDGFVDKKGKFRLGIEQMVYGRIRHKTWMEGQIVKEGSVSIIKGHIPEGAPPTRQRLIALVIPIASVMLLIRGEPLLAALAVVGIGYLLVMMRGDYFNSDRLLVEVEKTLKASPKPPKSMTAPTPKGK